MMVTSSERPVFTLVFDEEFTSFDLGTKLRMMSAEDDDLETRLWIENSEQIYIVI